MRVDSVAAPIPNPISQLIDSEVLFSKIRNTKAPKKISVKKSNAPTLRDDGIGLGKDW